MEPDDLIELMNAHQDAIYRFLKFLGADRSLAQTLTIEVFVAAYRSEETPEMLDAADGLPWLMDLAKVQFKAANPKKFGFWNTKENEFLEISEAFWLEVFSDDEAYIGKLQALHDCVSELPEHHTEMLDKVYKGQPVSEQEAEDLNVKYKTALPRIRTMLLNCVKKRQQLQSYPRSF